MEWFGTSAESKRGIIALQLTRCSNPNISKGAEWQDDFPRGVNHALTDPNYRQYC